MRHSDGTLGPISNDLLSMSPAESDFAHTPNMPVFPCALLEPSASTGTDTRACTIPHRLLMAGPEASPWSVNRMPLNWLLRTSEFTAASFEESSVILSSMRAPALAAIQSYHCVDGSVSPADTAPGTGAKLDRKRRLLISPRHA